MGKREYVVCSPSSFCLRPGGGGALKLSVPELFSSIGSSSACQKMNEHVFGVGHGCGVFVLVIKDLFT